MSSFINMLANDVWSETDIVNHTEAIIHSEFSTEAENILNRKVTGAILGKWTLTSEEQADVEHYAVICSAAHQAGINARADMKLLQSVLDYESAKKRLLLPAVDLSKTVMSSNVEGNAIEIPNPLIATDAAERQFAQAIITNSGVDVIELAELRSQTLV